MDTKKMLRAIILVSVGLSLVACKFRGKSSEASNVKMARPSSELGIRGFFSARPGTPHGFHVMALDFSNNGKFLASASGDQTIRIWHLANQNEKLEVLPNSVNPANSHQEGIEAVVFADDGRTLASGSSDKSIKIWDLNPDNGRLSIKQTIPAVSALREDEKAHDDTITALAFSKGGRFIASGGADKEIKLWSRSPVSGNYEIRGTVFPGIPDTHGSYGHQDELHSLSFANSRDLLVSTGADSTIKVWEINRHSELVHLQTIGSGNESPDGGHTGAINSIHFSEDDKFLVSGGQDMTIKIWDVNLQSAQHSQILTLRQTLPRIHTGVVSAVRFSKDAKYLVSASYDDSFKVWRFNSQSGQYSHLRDLLISDRPPIIGPEALVFSPNGHFLVMGGEDGLMYGWHGFPGALSR